MKELTILSAAVCGLLASAVGASASQVQVDISGQVNADLSTYSGGTSYPAGGTTVGINGIDFNLATFPTTTDLGVVQTIAVPGSSATALASYTFGGLNIVGVQTVYTLINSTFGQYPDVAGSAGLFNAL